MKRSFIIIVLITLCTFLYSKSNNNNTQKRRDYVPSDSVAIKIAEAIWLPIYGQGIYSFKPFKATLKNDSIWIVKGTLDVEMEGGTPYIEIQKRDCKILIVGHGK